MMTKERYQNETKISILDPAYIRLSPRRIRMLCLRLYLRRAVYSLPELRPSDEANEV